MAQPGIKELLEAGVHFGHQTRRWNPKMRRFIFGERDGIYIIDLLKTKRLLDQASEFAGTVGHRGGTVLFVGTKKQARDTIREVAEATGMPYVNHRWLGGLLTNFQTMSERIRRLHDLERYEAEGQLALLPTRERLAAQADLAKLRANLGGVKNMKGTPSAMFVVDLKTEAIAVREAQRLRIPIIGLVDTNCDPDGIDFVIPGNDDAIRSCAVIARAIGENVGQGAGIYRAEQERLRAEAEERARREAEERARREAEEAAAAEAAAAAAGRGSRGRGSRAGAPLPRRRRRLRRHRSRPSSARAAPRRRPRRRPRRPRPRRRRPRPPQRRRAPVADAPAAERRRRPRRGSAPAAEAAPRQAAPERAPAAEATPAPPPRKRPRRRQRRRRPQEAPAAEAAPAAAPPEAARAPSADAGRGGSPGEPAGQPAAEERRPAGGAGGRAAPQEATDE